MIAFLAELGRTFTTNVGPPMALSGRYEFYATPHPSGFPDFWLRPTS